MPEQPPNPLPLAWLGRPDAVRIGLAVAGYQFPGHPPRAPAPVALPPPDRDWDANWLMIRGEVECDLGRWSFCAPCLLTWELEDLIAWLVTLPRPPRPEIGFTEPLLEFRIGATCDNGAASRGEPGAGPDHLIRLWLRGEALPQRFDDETRWHTGVELPLVVPHEGMRVFLEAMRGQLGRYPKR